jgi:hypothetical protein
VYPSLYSQSSVSHFEKMKKILIQLWMRRVQRRLHIISLNFFCHLYVMCPFMCSMRSRRIWKKKREIFRYKVGVTKTFSVTQHLTFLISFHCDEMNEEKMRGWIECEVWRETHKKILLWCDMDTPSHLLLSSLLNKILCWVLLE